MGHTGHANFLLLPMDPGIWKYPREQSIKSTKRMKLVIESPKKTVGANAVFCQQEVRFYQLAVRSAPTSPKEQRPHPLVEVLID